MEPQEILRRLQNYDGTLPRGALREAIANKDTITPSLLRILEDARTNTQTLQEQNDYMAHIYAMYLLAQFREKRAYQPTVDFFSLPGELALELTGDVVTEDLNRILASVCGGDTSLITGLAENEGANVYVRHAALQSLLCLLVAGERSREEVLTYYKGLFHSDLSREPSHFWDGLVSCCTDLYPGEVYGEIQQAFREGLVDESFIGLKSIDRELALGKDKVLAKLHAGRNGLIGDIVSEIEWWACFQPPKQESTQVKRKVGRNEPCPCGSGKKYKRCCGGM